MKKVLFSLFSIGALIACNNTTEAVEDKTEMAEVQEVVIEEQSVGMQYYGDTIDAQGAVKASALYAMLENTDSVSTKVEGTINQSCKKKGCWMQMDMGDGKEMRVTFKDYGFFVPTDLDGETAIIEGYATMETTSIDDLRHYAVDGGMTEEEASEKYTEPEVAIAYVATGVIIKE
jgi:hypothetical protein